MSLHTEARLKRAIEETSNVIKDLDTKREKVSIEEIKKFNDLGFEYNPNVEVCFKDGTSFVTYGFTVLPGGKKVAMTWLEDGLSGSHEKYDLIPIQKKWYEDAKNFPCILRADAPYTSSRGNTISYVIADNQKSYQALVKYWSQVNAIYRLATKEEVSQMKVA